MDQRRQQWNAEKPVFSGGNELRFNKLGDEIVFGYFVSNGNDADRFMSLYKGHVVDTITSKGEKISVTKFCPVLSKMGDECALCDAGNTAIKDRMSMWLYIVDTLHTYLPEGKQLTTVPYNGRVYFREEVNAFKVWHASAWKESPWDDIVMMNNLYKGLHNFLWQMIVSDSGVKRRYKMAAVPDPEKTFTPEMYQRAQQECRPVMDLLREQLGSPVQAAPQMAPQSPPPAQATPLQAFQPGVPAPVPAPVATVTSTDSAALPEIIPEEDTKRPLKGMF